MRVNLGSLGCLVGAVNHILATVPYCGSETPIQPGREWGKAGNPRDHDALNPGYETKRVELSSSFLPSRVSSLAEEPRGDHEPSAQVVANGATQRLGDTGIDGRCARSSPPWSSVTRRLLPSGSD